jgi:hypothetical protein
MMELSPSISPPELTTRDAKFIDKILGRRNYPLPPPPNSNRFGGGESITTTPPLSRIKHFGMQFSRPKMWEEGVLGF